MVRSIYGLYDPRNPELVMVVGETKNRLEVRLSNYVSTARRKASAGKTMPPSHKWVAALLNQCLRPGIKLLTRTTDKEWREHERHYIALWRSKNPGLLNVLDGGDGSEDGKLATHCRQCGTEQVRTPSGEGYCPICRPAKWKARQREQGYKVGRRAYNAKPERRESVNAFNHTPKGQARLKIYERAKKLGLTVPEFRAYQELGLVV